MKTLYQAANAAEAHMLVDLLKQEGIVGYVEGEHLQGAIGGLPTAGFIRVVVDEGDYASAHTIVDRWEAKTSTEDIRPAKKPRSHGLPGLLVGIVLGVGASYTFFRASVTVDGIDYNHDGVLDEKWTRSASGTILKAEVDRNLDGKVDYVATYDRRGIIESAEADDDFDGVFETHMVFRDGNVERSEVDTNNDGFPDLLTSYRNGVIVSSESTNPMSGKTLRIEYFRLGLMFKAEMDTDGDGVPDTVYNYSRLGEVVSMEKTNK